MKHERRSDKPRPIVSNKPDLRVADSKRFDAAEYCRRPRMSVRSGRTEGASMPTTGPRGGVVPARLEQARYESVADAAHGEAVGDV